MILLDGTLGLDFINEHMIELANYLDEFTKNNMGGFKTIAASLGAVFALIVAGIQAYKVMSLQQGRFDILAIARPVLFAFILANWGVVVNCVTFPGKQLENYFREKYEVEKTLVVEKREERKKAAKEVTEKLREKKAAVEAAERAASAGEDKNFMSQAVDWVTDGFDKMGDIITGWLATAQSYFANWIESLFMWIGELFWQCSVYFIFLLKAIYMAVLILFGPVYMMFSILPAWKDTWAQWVGRAISVSLYGAMAYLVMIFSMQLMKYGIMADTDILNEIASGDEGLGSYMASSFGTSIQTLIGLICGTMAMKTVPEIATWAVPSQPIQASGQFLAGTASRIQSSATGAVSKLGK